ncbi:hypothetical protein [Fulvitalea axinellae]|uniref:hypothetical protein n=1 Tax=Fulvitalea axinellae TaxID=1182444 RepID=UPI0030CA26EC
MANESLTAGLAGCLGIWVEAFGTKILWSGRSGVSGAPAPEYADRVLQVPVTARSTHR